MKTSHGGVDLFVGLLCLTVLVKKISGSKAMHILSYH